jgi:hypothetical protein
MPFSNLPKAAVVDLDSRKSGAAGSGGGGGAPNAGRDFVFCAGPAADPFAAPLAVLADGLDLTFREGTLDNCEVFPLLAAGLDLADVPVRTVFLSFPLPVFFRTGDFAIRDHLTFLKSINYDE